MTEEQKSKDGIKEGLRAGLGILSALREAIEETIEEMRERGDISPDRAKEAVRSTMKKAQDAMGDAREKLDFVPRREFDALKQEVAELRSRITAHQLAGTHEGGGASSSDSWPAGGPATGEHYSPALDHDATPAGGNATPDVAAGTRSDGSG
jgi:polyhydroxyalkanoate synthesis regulator phasin